MLSRILAACSLVIASALAHAQPWPARPVKMIVPFPAGGPTDVMTRVVCDKLAQALGQPVVVENKPGAGGSIGTDIAAHSAADGYTLLAASSGPMSIMPSLQKIPYDPLKDFVLLGLISRNPYALVVNPSFPAANVKEFIALLKANPDKYTFASSGTGATAHLFGEYFNTAAQVKARHVPYKGSAPALADLIGGQIDYTIETVASVVGHVKAGRLKTFGTSFARRTTGMPDVPTLAEAAELPNYDIGAWIGYTAPPGTPREILTRLSAEIQKAVQAPELKEKYLSLGLEPVATTPDEMASFMRNQYERYGEVIRSANIKLE